MQDPQSGVFGRLPHENEPDDAVEVFDTFDALFVDAVRRVAQPR